MLLWETTPGDATGPQSNELGMPIPAVTSTTIAMVDADGTLHAFSKELGDLLWSTPGFDGANTRLVRQGDAAYDQQEWFVVLSANGPQQDDGVFVMTLSGLLAQTGERRWDEYVTGPLEQPVATNETMVFVVGNGADTGKAVAQSTPIVDGESHNHYVWTGSGDKAPAGGGQRLFAFDVETGQIIWIRTTAAGGFANLLTIFPNSGALYAVTTDGLLVSPSRSNGSIGGEPLALSGPVIGMVASGESGAIGSFATLSNGALVAFGGTPFSQQG
jgi:outer membrane protein assembly factor BamB